MSTANDVNDSDGFARLVDAAREAPNVMRVPAPDWTDLFNTDAVALLYRPQTVTRGFLRRQPAEPIAGMTPTAQAILKARVRDAL